MDMDPILRELLDEAERLLLEGRNDQARAVASRAYARSPEAAASIYARALMARGSERQHDGDTAGALNDYETARGLVPTGGLARALDTAIDSLSGLMSRGGGDTEPLPAVPPQRLKTSSKAAKSSPAADEERLPSRWRPYIAVAIPLVIMAIVVFTAVGRVRENNRVEEAQAQQTETAVAQAALGTETAATRSAQETEVAATLSAQETASAEVLAVTQAAVADADATSTVVAVQTADAEATTSVSLAETATVEAVQTADARATEYAIGTAVAAETATAEAVGTESSRLATEEAVAIEQTQVANRQEAESLALSRRLETAPQLVRLPAGNLVDDTAAAYAQQGAGVETRNFVASALFYNPVAASEGAWDYGFTFRRDEETVHYLYVTSQGAWVLGRGADVLDRGTVSWLNVGEQEKNTLLVLVDERSVQLFVNDIFVDEMALQGVPDSGNVGIAAWFVDQESVTGQRVAYDSFVVRTLDLTIAEQTATAESIQATGTSEAFAQATGTAQAMAQATGTAEAILAAEGSASATETAEAMARATESAAATNDAAIDEQARQTEEAQQAAAAASSTEEARRIAESSIATETARQREARAQATGTAQAEIDAIARATEDAGQSDAARDTEAAERQQVASDYFNERRLSATYVVEDASGVLPFPADSSAPASLQPVSSVTTPEIVPDAISRSPVE